MEINHDVRREEIAKLVKEMMMGEKYICKINKKIMIKIKIVKKKKGSE